MIIFTSPIFITYLNSDNEIDIVKLSGPVFTVFSNKDIDSLENDYQKRILINYEIIKRYAHKYKNIVNIYYEEYTIKM